jgi:transposase
MGLEVSARTLLRTVDHGEVQAPTPRVLGVDDFALAKGRTYGTLLCYLETGKPIDVLIGRTKQSLLGWLKNRSGIEIVARDRASSYADAVREGAPGAIQVADRFHLVKNVCDALKEVVDRQSWALPEPTPLPVSVSEPEPVPVASPEKRLTQAQQRRAYAADRLRRRHEEVHRLRHSACQSAGSGRRLVWLARPSVSTWTQARYQRGQNCDGVQASSIRSCIISASAGRLAVTTHESYTKRSCSRATQGRCP